MNVFSLVFGEDREGLAQKFGKGFESRPQQIHMARAVQEVLSTKRHLVVEAATGVGKSLAYLLPFIKWAVSNNTKVVISTYTKTLQEQLIKKDIPKLKGILGIDFRFALCLGSQNYLCIRRLRQNTGQYFLETDRERGEISRVQRWSKRTKTGLRSELDFRPVESVWNKICRESELCLGKKCLSRRVCFYYKARIEEYRAHILVTNHHLFFSHVASGNKVLPAFDAVVFDEAHTLENVATSYLGVEVSNFQIKYFLDSLFNPQSGRGFLRGIKGVPGRRIGAARQRLEAVRNSAQIFFSEVAFKFGQESRTIRLKNPQISVNYFKDSLSELVYVLKDILKYAERDEDKVQSRYYISHTQELNYNLGLIIYMQLVDYVYWLEILNRPRGIKLSFFAAPVDISGEFKKRVLDEIRPVILTSATLSVNGSFEFVKKSLGIGGSADELILDSPFDYSKNVLLYLPGGLPDPASEYEPYKKAVTAQIKKILPLMRGRTFILFTNFKMMNSIYAELQDYFGDLRILRQGEAPRYQLLEIFKCNGNAVLLGTNTFWQGIDVPGKALECVIIVKLPFAVPDDPIVEARMELLLARNKNPFIHYQIPQAVIMLRQGFGRLIRTKADRGLVAILDPRIKTKYYGRNFLRALPHCRQIFDLAPAEGFFQIK